MRGSSSSMIVAKGKRTSGNNIGSSIKTLTYKILNSNAGVSKTATSMNMHLHLVNNSG
jgi:hypothetical protein